MAVERIGLFAEVLQDRGRFTVIGNRLEKLSV